MGTEFRPTVIRATGQARVRWQLAELAPDEAGRLAWRYYPMGDTTDPRAALAAAEARLRERESWLGPRPAPDEVAEVVALRARYEAMAEAVARYEAGGGPWG